MSTRTEHLSREATTGPYRPTRWDWWPIMHTRPIPDRPPDWPLLDRYLYTDRNGHEVFEGDVTELTYFDQQTSRQTSLRAVWRLAIYQLTFERIEFDPRFRQPKGMLYSHEQWCVVGNVRDGAGLIEASVI